MNGVCESTIPNEAFEEVWSAISEGASVAVACRKTGMNKATFFRRVRDNPELNRRWQQAREERAEARAERYDDIERRLEAGELDPSTSKILLESLRWKMSKDDARFSDRTKTELSGPEGRPLIPEMPKNQSPLDELEIARFLAFTLEKQTRSPALLEASTK